jgi:peptide/nickel transport system permease protein
MARYIMQRLALGVVVLWGLASLVFFILHLVPGDPVRQALGGRASEETVAKVRAELGLDRPLLAQYQSFLVDLIHGDLGRSIALNASVTDILGQRLPPSLLLLGYALLIAVLIGVPLGIWSALRPNGAADHGIRLITTFIYGMPAFWLGLMLALFFGLKLGWFPVSGYEDGAGGALRSLTLPALTMGCALIVIITKTLRSNLIQVLGSDFIEAARSRGFSERRIVFGHAMRNAVIPTITVLATLLAYLIGGTVVIESVFRIPGTGSLLVQSIFQRDYQMVQAIAVLAGIVVVTASFATDLLHAALDPRVRIQR